MKHAVRMIILAAGILGSAGAEAQTRMATLDAVKARGFLNCGVSAGLPGFSQAYDDNWRGFDVDYCKAVAAAVIGDAEKVKYVATTLADRFSALKSGSVDVLIRNTTWTSSRDSASGLSFVVVNYYDGQGFIVKASRGIKSVMELNDATVCVTSSTTTEVNLDSFFKKHGMRYRALDFDKFDEIVPAYLADRCDAYTGDLSGLHTARVLQARPSDHVLLPEVISKEPLGPFVAQGDSRWFTVVRWVHFALLIAEELGVTQEKIDELATTADPEIKRLLGKEGNFGRDLGLDNEFAAAVLRAVGNYGEIFDRNLGSRSRLKIKRGLNNLWNNGGLQYAPPLR